MRHLVSIVGSGRVGTSTALFLMLKEICDIRLIDIVEGLPQGEALDLSHAAALLGKNIEITGSNDYRDIAGSDVVIITAGLARKPGMTREELAFENAKIVKSVCEKVAEYAPHSIVIVVTNPLDIMTHVAIKVLNFPRERVIGFSGTLDSARFRYYIAKRVGVSPRSVEAYVVGQHGEKMVPLASQARVLGKPLQEVLRPEEIREVIEETIKAGEKIVQLKKWSAYHAVGAGIAEIVDCILKDKKELHNFSALLRGEYGYTDVVAEVVGVLGRRGIEKIVEIPMTEEERRRFDEAITWIRQLTQQVFEKLGLA